MSAKPNYQEIGGTIYRDGHVVEDSAEIADALVLFSPVCNCGSYDEGDCPLCNGDTA